MFDPSLSLSEDSNRRYEQACDQAIAMCDGICARRSRR